MLALLKERVLAARIIDAETREKCVIPNIARMECYRLGFCNSVVSGKEPLSST
jgi:hypothetical protein